ncbi:hypothetical protein QW131_31770 [Roseibium salinum]|nr:hypothetical protein [Roseibium salinum]
MVLSYLATRLRSKRIAAVARPDLAPGFGFLAGLVHGATGLSGLVGPPYMHSLHLPRPAFVFAAGSMFALFSLMQAPVLGALGLLQPQALGISMLVLPMAFLGLWIGGKAGTRMQSQTFFACGSGGARYHRRPTHHQWPTCLGRGLARAATLESSIHADTVPCQPFDLQPEGAPLPGRKGPGMGRAAGQSGHQ